MINRNAGRRRARFKLLSDCIPYGLRGTHPPGRSPIPRRRLQTIPRRAQPRKLSPARARPRAHPPPEVSFLLSSAVRSILSRLCPAHPRPPRAHFVASLLAGCPAASRHPFSRPSVLLEEMFKAVGLRRVTLVVPKKMLRIF